MVWIFFFKQKTAYEMRISDWSSDVCSSDLSAHHTYTAPPLLSRGRHARMYIEFFQLKEMPFSITPDPAYLYMSPRHQEALGHLLYGTGQYGGFVQLTGEVGTGKTTIVRTLLEQKPDKVDVAFIPNQRQTEKHGKASCRERGWQYV